MVKLRQLTAAFLTMPVLLLAACQGTETLPSDPSTPLTSASDASPGEPAYGGLVPLAGADDPIEFRVYVRDPGMVPAADNPVLQTIAELTGVTLRFEFLVGDLDQKLRVMIAGRDYPDAIFTGDSSKKLIQAGAFIPLEDKIPQYPNLYDLYGQVMPYMERADGHIYTLELFGTLYNDTTRPAPGFEADSGFYIQKAVLAEFGYPTIRTVEEYFDLLSTYMSRYPMIEGTQTIGFEMLADGWRNWALLTPVQYLLGAGNDGLMYVDPETLETSFYQISDTAYRYYRILNNAYREGLIAPQALTQSYEQYLHQISTGSVLGFFDQSWNFASAQRHLLGDAKFNRTYVSLPLVDEGVQDHYIDQAGIPTGINGLGITVNCKDPDRLLLFYDWLLQREVQDYLQWGELGVDWVYDENGEKVLTPARRAIMNDDAQMRDVTGHLVWYYSPKWQGIYTADGAATGHTESYGEYMAALSDFDRDLLRRYGCEYPAQLHAEATARPLYYPLWAMSLEESSPAHISEKKIEDVLLKYYPRLILAASPDQYDDTWQEFVEEFTSIDLAAYQDEIEQQIAILMERDAPGA